MKNFKINMAFQLEKDKSFTSIKVMKTFISKKYELSANEVRELAVTIIKYQVKKYGRSLATMYH